MTVYAVRNIVRPFFTTAWQALHATYPVVDSGQPKFGPGVVLPWVKFLIGPSDERQRWMGAPRGFVQAGFFSVNVHVPRTAAWNDGHLAELADQAADIFTGNVVSGVRFEREFGAGVRRGPLLDDPDGPWRVAPITVPYEYEFTKA